SYGWLEGRIEKGMSWFRALAGCVPSSSQASESHDPTSLAIRRAPTVPQLEPRIAAKPPAGRLRRTAPIVIDKLPKKPVRPGAK
ncbi:MAG TPA: hypothetical protein VHM01_22475, partial [Alphaproteobacteria bacterium]|nr:hypothetical protein [Alphaproteobacteria bacterium]